MQVTSLTRYPVKSFQGIDADELDVVAGGIPGDRRWGLISEDGAHVLSAKRYRILFEGETDGVEIWWPGSARWALPTTPEGDPDLDAAVSDWVGVRCGVQAADPGMSVSYEMTFDPPDDAATYYEIGAPAGAFVDLAPLHLIVRETVSWCASRYPELNWDLRRFRPNVVVDAGGDHAPFSEDEWVGRELEVGTAVLRVMQPVVRCAMPLRAQPARAGHPALERQPGLYQAIEELHANHLGLYVEVVQPGRISVGDTATLQ